MILNLHSFVPYPLGVASAPQALGSFGHLVQGLVVVSITLLLVWVLVALLKLASRYLRLGRMPSEPDLAPEHGLGVRPEIVAVIAAAVAELMDSDERVSITPLARRSEGGAVFSWSSEGRRQHFASHKVR